MGHDTNATAAGVAADALEHLVRARMDAESRGLHVPGFIRLCSRRWRQRSCRSRCLGARSRTRSAPRFVWRPGSACGGWLRIRLKVPYDQGFHATESDIKTAARGKCLVPNAAERQQGADLRTALDILDSDPHDPIAVVLVRLSQAMRARVPTSPEMRRYAARGVSLPAPAPR
jgi:hypothetical protein